MKKLVFILIIFIADVGITKSYSQSITFTKTDGTSSNYSLTSSSIITFQDDNLIYDQSVFTSVVDDIRKIIFTTSAGIQNQTSDSQLLIVSPNPATETISFSTDINETCTVKIFSITGSVVISTSINPTTESLYIAGLQKGIYIVKIKNQTAKFIKL